MVAWLEKQGEQKPTNVCEGCNNVKGCVACVDGSEWAHIEEQEPALSEEDETALCDALWCCKQAASVAKDENDMGNVWYAERWLKSLKERIQPQNTWKPSDEQIEVLSKHAEQNNYDGSVLTALYQELKKLKGE